MVGPLGSSILHVGNALESKPTARPKSDPLVCVLCRTDTTTIAVNGFAADGKVLVQRVQQRLEVSLLFPLTPPLPPPFALVTARPCETLVDPDPGVLVG